MVILHCMCGHHALIATVLLQQPKTKTFNMTKEKNGKYLQQPEWYAY